ncbi:MAG: hypothetical protein ACK55O_13205 [Phycisphaerales bacterium]
MARSVESGQALHQAARVSRLSAAALAVALGVGAAPAAGQTSETFYEPYFTSFDSTSGAFGRRCDLNIGGPHNCVFWGGASGFATAEYEYRISNFVASCGASTFSAVAQIGGWQSQGDYAIVYFMFLDSNRNQTGLVQLGPVTPAERGNQTRLLWRSASGAVPANTVFVRLRMEMHRVSGTNNDGYIGDTEITINTPNIDTFDPENGAIRIRNVGGEVQLTLATHPGYTPPSVMWTSPSRGVLQDGTYPDGLFVSGATTQTLTLGNLQRIDSGTYQARTETAACSRTTFFSVDVGCVSGPLQMAGSAVSSPPPVQRGGLVELSVEGDSAVAVVAEDEFGRVLNLSLFRRRTDAWGLPWWDLEAQQSVTGNVGGSFEVAANGSTIAYPTNGPTGIETQLYGLTPQGTLGPLGTIQWPPAAPDSSGYYVYALGDGVIAASSGPNIAFASRGQNGWSVTETMHATDFVPEADFASVISIVGDKMLLVTYDYAVFTPHPFRWFGIIRHASGRWSTGMRYELDVYEPQVVSGGSTVEVIDVFGGNQLWSLSSTGWVNEGRVLGSSWSNSIGGYPVRAPGSLLSWERQSGIPHLLRRTRTPAGWSLIGISPFGDRSSSALSSWASIDSQTAVFADRLPSRSVVFTAYNHTDPIARQLPEFIPESQTGDPGVTFIRFITSSPDPARHTWRFRGQPITGPSLPPPYEHVAATPSSSSAGVFLSLATNGTPITAADITLAVLDPCSNATFEYPCANSELEPNDFLDAPSIPLSSGQSIIGTSYGATSDGSPFSRDYLGILATPATSSPASPAWQFSPDTPIITRHRFSVRAAEPTLGNPPRFSVDLRGHGASNGVVNTSTAVPIQVDVPPAPEIERIITTVQWYGLGPDPARMDVRIAAKPDSPQGQYIGTLQSERVRPASLPWPFSAGPMTFTTNIDASLIDTAMWLYDQDLRPIPGLGNDDTPTGPNTGFFGATISATLRPGRYYLALSLFPLSTPEPLPSGSIVGGSVTATPNVAVSGSSLERTNVTLRVQSSGRQVEFANAPGGSAPASIDFPCRFIDRNEILWIEVNVGWPVSDCAAADIADTDAGTVFTGSGPDNIIDNGDFTAFFTAFFTDPADPAHLVADIADTDAQYPPVGFRDGVVDNGDFTAFFASFFSGGCAN